MRVSVPDGKSPTVLIIEPPGPEPGEEESPIYIRSGSPLVLIGHGYTTPYLGGIDEVRLWNVARSQAEAVAKAIQQDRMFDNPETRARIATDIEKQQWQLDQERQRERQRDSDQDAAQIRARLGTPQPAGGEPTGEWSVRDRAGFLVTTLRPPEAMQSQTGAERYAQNWIARSRPDLDALDITVTQLTTEPEPIPGLSQGEFTGRWEIRDSQGRVLHDFGGIGNNQSDANRFAAGWLGQVRPDLAGTEVEVVPVMG